MYRGSVSYEKFSMACKALEEKGHDEAPMNILKHGIRKLASYFCFESSKP